MKIAVLDDEIKYLEEAGKLIEEYCSENETEIEYMCFNSFSELIEKEKFDFYILDYIMPEKNGVEVALALKEKFGEIKVAYLTTYETAAIDVINNKINAEAFILKPIEKEKLFSLMKKIEAALISDRIILKKEHNSVVINPRDIFYLEASLKNTIFYFEDRNEIFPYRISALEKDYLDPGIFVKVQRSFIVNILHVERYDAKEITMRNGDKVPLSFLKEFQRAFTKYVMD